jgi:hypothetical protein
LTEPGRIACVLYTFDIGYHSSGWWRNSDYERCYHLSVSHPGALGLPEAPSDDEVRWWARLAWPKHYHMSWFEPPAGVLDPHRRPNVAHVRLFVDERKRPIQPEAEVYTLKPWADGTSPEKVFR